MTAFLDAWTNDLENPLLHNLYRHIERTGTTLEDIMVHVLRGCIMSSEPEYGRPESSQTWAMIFSKSIIDAICYIIILLELTNH